MHKKRRNNMFNYENLKKSQNGIPTWDALIPIVIHISLQKESWSSKSLRVAVANASQLPADLRSMMYESGNGNIIEDRASWAISTITIAGLLERPRRGMYKASDLGRELHEKYGESLDATIVKSQPKYFEHMHNLKDEKQSNKNISPLDTSENTITPQELMESAFSKINAELKDEILNEIMMQEPVFFERLVVKLLIKMGYGGSLNGKGIVTPPSNDEGIDGIIREDKLGFSNIYIQAKRYAIDNTIGRPDIQAFVGAIARREGKGLFITTGKFSSTAKEYAIANHIVLVDGNDLADLMIEYNLGISPMHAYEIKRIDTDFFDENGM
jgi:restriction system protein